MKQVEIERLKYHQSISLQEAYDAILKDNIPIVKEWKSIKGKQLAFPTLENCLGLVQLQGNEILGLNLCYVYDENPPFEKMNDFKFTVFINKAIEKEGFQKNKTIYAFGGETNTDWKAVVRILNKIEYTVKTIENDETKKRWLCEVFENELLFKTF